MKMELLDSRIMNTAAAATARARNAGGLATFGADEAAAVLAVGRETAAKRQTANEARAREQLDILRNATTDTAVREAIAHEVLVVLKREYDERERIRNRAHVGVWYATFEAPYDSDLLHLEALRIVNALSAAFGVSAPPVRWCRELSADEAHAALRRGDDNLEHHDKPIGAFTDPKTIHICETERENRDAIVEHAAHEALHCANVTKPEADVRSFGLRFADQYQREGFPQGDDLAGLCAAFAESEGVRS